MKTVKAFNNLTVVLPDDKQFVIEFCTVSLNEDGVTVTLDNSRSKFGVFTKPDVIIRDNVISIGK